MAAIKGHKHRTGVANTVRIGGRVHPDQAAKVRAITDALGISVASYLDQLLAREQLDDRGRPVWWQEADPSEVSMGIARG